MGSGITNQKKGIHGNVARTIGEKKYVYMTLERGYRYKEYEKQK